MNLEVNTNKNDDNHHHMDVTLQWVHLTKVVQVKDTNRSTSVKNSTITNGGTDQTLRFKKQPEDDNHKTKPSHIQPQSKIILNQVSGQAKAGEILAILGPSGSGKTSLLDCIATRSNFQHGHLLYHSHPVCTGHLGKSGKAPRTASLSPPSPLSSSSTFDDTVPSQSILQKHLKRNMAYIQQNDIFFSHLTVHDQLTYTALLRLGDDVPTLEKHKHVKHMIHLLQLHKCQHTPIRLISGGERKRVNIATELLTNPSILLLDEPTSGLDSTSAVSLMTLLSSLATKFQKTIITSIHQPSSKTYFSFHKVLFLTDGCVVYYGTPQHSLEYLQKLDMPCPDGYNAADHWMDLLVNSPTNDGNDDDDNIRRNHDDDDDKDETNHSNNDEEQALESPFKRKKYADHHHQHYSPSFVPLTSIHVPNPFDSTAFNGIKQETTNIMDKDSNQDYNVDGKQSQQQDVLLLKQQRPILANTTYPSMMGSHDDNHSSTLSSSRNDESNSHIYCSGVSDTTTTYQTAKSNSRQNEDSIMTTTSSFPIRTTAAVDDDDDVDIIATMNHPGNTASTRIPRLIPRPDTATGTSVTWKQNKSEWKRKSNTIQTFMSRLSTMTVMTEKAFNILDETKKKREEYLDLTTTKAQLINAWDVDKFALEMERGAGRRDDVSLVRNTTPSNSESWMNKIEDYADLQSKLLTEKKFNTRWTTQFRVLLHRSLKNSKSAVLTKINFIKSIALGVLSGFLWFQMPYDEQHVQDRGSFLFFASTYWIFDGIFEAIFAFPMERDVIFKERASGSYHLSAYFLAKTVSEMPTRLLLPSLYWSISYWMTNLNPRVDVFFGTMFSTLLSVLTGESYGLLCGALVMDFETSMTYMIVISLTTMAAGGFYVDNIPSFIEWLKYLSPFKFGYEANQIMVFDRDVSCDGSGYLRQFCLDGVGYVSKKDVLNVLHSENSVGLNLGILFVLMIVPRYLAFLALKSKKAAERS